MTYNKPEMEIEKFNLIDEITAGEVSAAGTDGGNGGIDTAAAAVDNTVGSDLIIG